MSWRTYLIETWHEIRAGMRGPLFPVASVGLTIYLLLVLSSAENMQSMGAAGVPRNSGHLVYMMSSGMSLWLLFIWAWVFAQVVFRDRQVNLHENVLSAPVSLRGLFIARYLGASVVALLLGAILPFGMLLVPVLGWLGTVPQELIGATPWSATVHSFFLFMVPQTFGTGALFICVTIWMRTIAAPFLLAALYMVVWMIGMIVLREGGVSDFWATVFDPTGFAETELQSFSWTPEEKISRPLDHSPALILNRVFWCLLPIFALAFLLLRVDRERLVLERSKPVKATSKLRAVTGILQPGPLGKPSWLATTFTEAGWHIKQSFANWGLLLGLGILTAIGIGGSFSHLLQHGDGPILPRWQFLMPFMGEFFFLFMLFMTAGFVGSLSRRDMRPGFDEMIDTSSAPDGTRAVGRAMAAVVLTIAITLSPALGALIVSGIGAPGFSVMHPLMYQLLAMTPALLEVCAITLLVHALIRHTGTAYAVSMILGFIAIVNHELNLISYPPAQLVMPPHLAISAISGWEPWLAGLLALDMLKIGVLIALVGVSWMVWPRGKDLTLATRWQMAGQRLFRGAGAMTVAGTVTIGVASVLLYDRLVTEGEYESLFAEQDENAAWEQRWWQADSGFSLSGGEVRISVSPQSRLVEAEIRYRNVVAPGGNLLGELPHGAGIDTARVDGEMVAAETAYDQFALPLGSCAETGCDVTLDISLHLKGWALEHQSWLRSSGVWLRAEDVLPTLGLDPDRRLKAPLDRRTHGLDEQSTELETTALAATGGVAPEGDWQWQVEFEQPGNQSRQQGQFSGPLNFAVVWTPESSISGSGSAPAIWHSDAHTQVAIEIREDLTNMQQCVDDLLGASPQVNDVVQIPRELGEVRLYDGLLWLPEDLGWDVTAEGFGRELRRTRIASALARASLERRIRLRDEPGAQWLIQGVSGWAGLECLRQRQGEQIWVAMMERHSSDLAEEVGTLEYPVERVSHAGDVDWMHHYTPLAVQAWAARIGNEGLRQQLNLLIDHVNQGVDVASALVQVTSPQFSQQMLGMPLASDIAVIADRNGQPEVKARRWQWDQGGWQPLQEPELVVHKHSRSHEGSVLTLEQFPQSASTAHEIIALDSWPSAERTPTDNYWQPEASPGYSPDSGGG